MTPEERRARVEYVIKMAEQGLLVEPAYHREAWLQEHGSEASPQTPQASSGRRKPDWGSKHPATESPQEDAKGARGTSGRRKPASRRSA